MIQRSWRASPGRIDRLAAELDEPVGVGEGPGLLGERARRQDDVGEVRGLGQEDVLDDEMLERGERIARVVRVGVRHRRVLAHDVHAADAAVADRVHHLDDRQPRLRVEAAPASRQARSKRWRASSLATRW